MSSDLEHPRGEAFLFAQQAEQDVLRSDVVVLERPSLVLGENDDLPGPFGESFEQTRPFLAGRLIVAQRGGGCVLPLYGVLTPTLAGFLPRPVNAVSKATEAPARPLRRRPRRFNMGQGHAGARDPLCRAGFHPRSHCRGDPSRRPAGTFGAADKPRLGKSGLHDAERLRDLARLEGLELRALVAASSGRGTSLRGCFSIARRKRVGAGLEASVAHGAADHDHLLQSSFSPCWHCRDSCAPPGISWSRQGAVFDCGDRPRRSSRRLSRGRVAARRERRSTRDACAPGHGRRSALLQETVHLDWRRGWTALGRLGRIAPGRVATARQIELAR